MKTKSFWIVFPSLWHSGIYLRIRCLTCPGCTGWSILSFWSGIPLCSQVDPDSQGRATVGGRPAAPAPGSESSCSAGNEWSWRPKLPLEKHRNNILWVNLWCFKDKYSVTYLNWSCRIHHTWCRGVRVQRIRSCLCHLHHLPHSLVIPTLHM